MAFRALQRPQTTLLKRFAAVRTNMSESAFHSKFAEQRLGVKHHAGGKEKSASFVMTLIRHC